MNQLQLTELACVASMFFFCLTILISWLGMIYDAGTLEHETDAQIRADLFRQSDWKLMALKYRYAKQGYKHLGKAISVSVEINGKLVRTEGQVFWKQD